MGDFSGPDKPLWVPSKQSTGGHAMASSEKLKGIFRLCRVLGSLAMSRPSSVSQEANSLDDKTQELRVEIWKKAVETQMHFNEMSVKSRQLGLSFVVAALGVAVVLLGKPDEFQIPVALIGYEIHPSGLIITLAAFGTYAVKRLDLGVYHKMLRGAVAFGEDLEKTLRSDTLMPTTMGMTESISHYSRGLDEPKRRTTAATKITKFYWLLIIVLLVIGIVMLIATAEPLPLP